jgi:hypothetical protein
MEWKSQKENGGGLKVIRAAGEEPRVAVIHAAKESTL